MPSVSPRAICSQLVVSAASPIVWAFRAGSTEGRRHTYDHGVTVEERVGWFGWKRRIVVTYPDGTQVDFNRTDRTLDQLHGKKFYPENFLFPAYLRGLKVLDFGCGGGQLVERLRREGVDAHGLDIYLNRSQRTKSHFVMADGAYTPYGNETFDVVMSTWSAVAYLMFDANGGLEKQKTPEQRDFARRAAATVLGEMIRVTKKGGVIRLSPMLSERVGDRVEYPQLQSILNEYYPNVRIKSRPNADWLSSFYFDETPSPDIEGSRFPSEVWVELERVD